MIIAPISDNENQRLEALKRLGILDTPPEERFDVITREASVKLGVPISTISIIDAKREWYKSRCGLTAQEGERDISFCGHAMQAEYIFVIEDTLTDNRFKDNPYVTGAPFIRFYAGVALHDRKTKLPVGVLCVKDVKPRKFSPAEVVTLIELARQAEDELNKPRL
jgi:GAF domain-containing protein